MSLLLNDDLKLLYARALVSIARADGLIDADEGDRLRQRILERSQLDLEDILLEHSLLPAELAEALQGGPFRGVAVRGDELARLLVEDGLYVALAKGHITSEEAARLWRYGTALGLSDEELRTLTAGWIP
jgi:tellurite resistance protein